MDLGLERAGMECRWQVEIDPFANKVLAKHWPQIPRYGDIRAIKGVEIERVDCIAGGFPCQDVSRVGSRIGIGGSRSGLWADFFRLVVDVRPRYVIVENVPGLLDGGIGRVLGDLAAGGYDAEWRCLSAAQFGLPHIRERVFVIAYPRGSVAGHIGLGELLPTKSPNWEGFLLSARERSPNGLSRSMDRSVRLGNAVVPDCAEWIGRRIMEHVAQSDGIICP